MKEILDQFRTLRALVVGDLCLDRWCRYDPSLADPSRETGIPRIAVVSTEVTPGGGGTVAANLVALGARRVDVLGVLGDDGFGLELQRALEQRGISTEYLVRAQGVSTFTYTKLLSATSGAEDVPRVDFLYGAPLPDISQKLESIAPAYDVILVADQAETAEAGVVTPCVRETLARIAAVQLDTVTWADSRVRAEHFRGVVLKINREEAEAASQRACGSVDLEALRRHTECPLLFVTSGKTGATLIDGRGATTVETRRIAGPVDICGAGDSFSAAAALTLRVTRNPITAARIGNLAASITIMKPGTGTASPAEILAAGC
jgi:rfaE bifunctional protein kinase chain/domain